jgi:hypothetical protein
MYKGIPTLSKAFQHSQKHSNPVEIIPTLYKAVPTLYKGIPTLYKACQLCTKHSNPVESIPTL